MNLRPRRTLSGFLLIAALAAPGAASAAPVTLNLRIEGPTTTLFEGDVTTDIRRFQFSGDTTDSKCDGTSPQGSGTTPAPTRGAALMAAKDQGLDIRGNTFSFGVEITSINGQNVAFDSSTGKFLAEYENEAFANFGACGDDAQTGDRALFAYGDGSETLLRLSGPSSATIGVPFSVTVTNAASSAPLSGATVGGATSGADGQATVTANTCGTQTLKAERPASIRSNALRVAVGGCDGGGGSTTPTPTATPEPTPGADAGGSPEPPVVTPVDLRAPRALVGAIRDGQTFARGKGPRELRGTIGELATTRPLRLTPDVSGVREVKLRLTRRDGRRCQYFSGRSERFRGARCGADRSPFFAIGSNANWRYLLPSRLPRGRYVLDVKATDRAGNSDPAVRRGSNRVVFVVR